MEKIQIGVFVGSLRKESYNRKIAREFIKLMPGQFEMQELEIGQLPLYNQDFEDEGQTPPEWDDFRAKVKELDGVLFVTPEYNRSVPAVLKNALDVASRPFGHNAWDAKPGAVISVSTGAQGGFGANHHLRQTLVFLNIYTMQQPEIYIGKVADSLGPNSEIANERTKKFLQSAAAAFAAWVQRFVVK